MKKIVIATKNRGKVREMREALSHLPVEVVSLAEFGALPDAVEDGKTFAENARIKASFYRGKTGCACLADDSGLDDATNNAKLMEELRKAGVESSPADYRCALAFVDEDGTSLLTEGRCDGTVRMVPKGENGFGYDPYFYTEAYPGRTMAELSLEEKDAISHRGRALRAMVKELEERLR